MNREIKFRAWGNNSKAIIQWDNLRPNLSLAFEHARQGALTLMQFTGLKDKNGKEIYEGDVVKLTEWTPENYEVVFDRGGFCLKLSENSNFYPDIKYAEQSTIIGNIYENPELLKTK